MEVNDRAQSPKQYIRPILRLFGVFSILSCVVSRAVRLPNLISQLARTSAPRGGAGDEHSVNVTYKYNSPNENGKGRRVRSPTGMPRTLARICRLGEDQRHGVREDKATCWLSVVSTLRLQVPVQFVPALKH